MIYWILGSIAGIALLTVFLIWLCNREEKGGQ